MSDIPTEISVPVDFSTLGLKPVLLAALAQLGYEEPTPIQREAIPLLLEGRDLFGQAATGTGKTAAFALPMLNRLDPGKSKPFEAAALVLVPTRELAVQVAEAVHSYGKGMGVSVLPIYGGQEISVQLRRLKFGVDVVVATPGRALDHLRRKTLKLERVRMVVLDEADEMLDMGFAEDLDAILSELPDGRQTALFSATLPPRIATIADRHLKNPAKLKIRQERTPQGSAPKVRQTAYMVSRSQKVSALGRVLDLEAPKSAIVFCRTRTEVDSLTDTLTGLGFRAEPLHGGMSQEQRERVMKRFKAGTTETLVATDVAARGLHIEKLSHVFNYDLPTAPEAYVHRIGRTGRAGHEGVAISFADPREHRLLKNIERATGQRIEIAVVPTASDLRARKLELMQSTLRELLLAGELEPFRIVVETLAGDFDVMDVAAAAVKLSLSLSGEQDRTESSLPAPKAEAPASFGAGLRDRPRSASLGGARGRAGSVPHSARRGPSADPSGKPYAASAPKADTATASKSDTSAAAKRDASTTTSNVDATPAAKPYAATTRKSELTSAATPLAATSRKSLREREDEQGRESTAASSGEPGSKSRKASFTKSPASDAAKPRPDSAKARGEATGKSRGAAPSEAFVKLFVGAGRIAGIRPADLVGAIANEAGLEPSRIGSIQITDVYSLVEVPAEMAPRVMVALRQTTLRGRKVKVDIQRAGRG